MTAPYLSRRTGSTQWLMQRASALLLVGLAFTHFAIQHFTSDAVSTGLTVAVRLNNPWWQAYYVLFIVLVLYHGINGLVGIQRDYNPRTWLRVVIEVLLWSVAAFFAARGIANVVNPALSTAEAKARYAANGFPAGESVGNPPSVAKAYDFRSELRELFLLEYYLAKHTHRTDTTATATVFGHQPGMAVTPETVAQCGVAFDRWLGEVIADPQLGTQDRRDRSALFSSTYEFAVWAKEVRLRNAAERQRLGSNGGARAHEQAILERLPTNPVYNPVELH